MNGYITISRSGSTGSSGGICIIGSIASDSASATGNSSRSTITFYVREYCGKGQKDGIAGPITDLRAFGSGLASQFRYGKAVNLPTVLPLGVVVHILAP